jgi:hypothetical protein
MCEVSMTQFAVDANNDLYLNESNDLAIVSGKDDLIQTVISSIKLWLKEYEYNTSLGVNYKQMYGNPHLLPEYIDYNLRAAILLVNSFLTPENLANYGIKTINSLDYNLDRNTRIMKVNVEIKLNNNTTTTIETSV